MGCLPGHISVLKVISKGQVKNCSPRELLLGKGKGHNCHFQVPGRPWAWSPGSFGCWSGCPTLREHLVNGTPGSGPGWVDNAPLFQSFFLRSIEEPAPWGSMLYWLLQGVSVSLPPSYRDVNWVVSRQQAKADIFQMETLHDHSIPDPWRSEDEQSQVIPSAIYFLQCI